MNKVFIFIDGRLKVNITIVLILCFVRINCYSQAYSYNANGNLSKDTIKYADDSLTQAADTLKSTVNSKLDSIEISFNKQVDSLKQSYGQTKTKIESLKSNYQLKIDSLNNFKLSSKKLTGKIDSLNNLKLSTQKYTGKIDSLSNLKLPTEKYTNKIDSLNKELAQIQQKATAKIDSLKSKVAAKVKSLNLPPEAEERVSKLTASLDKLNLPSIEEDIGSKLGLGNINSSLPNLPAGGISAGGLPNVNLPSTDVSLPSVTIPGSDIQSQLKGITGKAEGIQQQIQEGVSADKIGQTLENKVSGLDQVKAIQEQAGTLPGGVPKTGEEAKKQMVNMAKKEAMNHFAGKEAALQQAMDKMSKYKEKYSSVTSINDLPKRRPNPMRGKPFIERLVPGITLQFQNFHYFMLDVNASAGYRFTEHMTGGIGWNQRWAYSMNENEFSPSAHIYGVRSYGEYEFKKGFGVRADIEYMNAMVTEGTPSNEISHREWVWSAFSGIKQEYRISRSLRGNVQVMYNLFDPHHKSPYVDRLNVRMGFEVVLKAKATKKK